MRSITGHGVKLSRLCIRMVTGHAKDQQASHRPVALLEMHGALALHKLLQPFTKQLLVEGREFESDHSRAHLLVISTNHSHSSCKRSKCCLALSAKPVQSQCKASAKPVQSQCKASVSFQQLLKASVACKLRRKHLYQQ